MFFAHEKLEARVKAERKEWCAKHGLSWSSSSSASRRKALLRMMGEGSKLKEEFLQRGMSVSAYQRSQTKIIKGLSAE